MQYPFSPEILDAMPEELAELFRGLEMELLERIGRQLKAGDGVNEVTLQDIRALRSHGVSLNDIKKAIQDVTGLSRTKLNNLFADAVKRNQSYYTELMTLSKVTAPARLLDTTDIDAIAKQTNDMFANITASMGFLVDGGNRALPPAKAYEWALDKAAIQVQSGVTGYNQAIASAVKELADSGLKVVDYESGHVDSVDVAVRRAVLTGINQLNQKYREQSADYLETDLIEVTAHRGARDKGLTPENHKLWQGKVYRWSDKPRTSTGDYPDFVEVCGYGLGEGIGGWNCRHSFYPFVEGVSQRTYTDEQLENIDPPPFEYEGKTYSMYEATQKQRQIERSIRKQKRLETAYKAAGLEEDYTAARTRRRRLEEKYKEFSKAAGLPEQKDRTKVLYTDDKSVAQAERIKAQNVDNATMGRSLSIPTDNNSSRKNNSPFDMEQAKSEYTEFIKTIPDSRRQYFERAFDGATYQMTDNPSLSFAYIPQNDTIVYNPSHPAFQDFAFEIANTHELAHRIDLTMFFNSFQNKDFSAAIQAAREVIDGKSEEFLRLADADQTGFMSDIFSAITKNDYLFSKGHDKEYWLLPHRCELETFANILSMEALKQDDFLNIIKENFPEIMKAYDALWE